MAFLRSPRLRLWKQTYNIKLARWLACNSVNLDTEKRNKNRSQSNWLDDKAPGGVVEQPG